MSGIVHQADKQRAHLKCWSGLYIPSSRLACSKSALHLWSDPLTHSQVTSRACSGPSSCLPQDVVPSMNQRSKQAGGRKRVGRSCGKGAEGGSMGMRGRYRGSRESSSSCPARSGGKGKSDERLRLDVLGVERTCRCSSHMGSGHSSNSASTRNLNRTRRRLPIKRTRPPETSGDDSRFTPGSGLSVRTRCTVRTGSVSTDEA